MHLRLDKYKAVFFDAGDTLLTIPHTDETVLRLMRAHGLRPAPDKVRQSLGEAIREHYLEREPDHAAECSPEIDRRYWVGIYMDMLSRSGHGADLSRGGALAFCEAMYEAYVAPERYELFPDVKETLHRLNGRGMRIGLVSNFAPTLRDILDRHGLANLFDPLIVSTEVGVEKPNPAIFRIALEQAGLRADEVLYVGDHPVNDIRAARLAGMDAVRILREPDAGDEGIRTLLDLTREEAGDTELKRRKERKPR